MKFHYVAFVASGKTIEGDIEANSPSDVLQWMASQGYRPVSVKPVVVSSISKRFGSFASFLGGGINLTDKVFITKYLSLMLKVGTDLFKAIDILISDFDKPSIKIFLGEIRDNLSQGKPFNLAFEKYNQYFSTVEINLIKAGERSGGLEKVFSDLSTSLEKNQDLKNRVRAALIYPIILVVVSLLVLLLMITFVLPKIANVFSQSGQKPPLFSRIVFGVGLFANKYSYIIFPFLIISVLFSWYFFAKNPLGRAMLGRFLDKVPILKQIIKHLAIQRFASTLASLLRAGIPILEALDITAGAVGSDELKSVINRIAKDGIAKGATLGEAFRKESYFPKVVTNLIAISEKAGHMEDILQTLADFYASEVDSSVKVFVSFLEPALLIILGGVVGLIALSVIIPIYQLVSTV